MNTIARIPILAVLALALAPSASRAQQAFQTSWLGYESGTHSTAEWPWAMRLADLDGDGDVDIATVNWWFHHKLGIQMNNGDGTFAPAVYYNHALGSLGLVVADITGDGQPDVVVSNTGANGEGSTVSLFRNLGGGTFATQQQFTVGSGSFVGPVGLAAADFNADGRIDVAVALNGLNGIGSGNQVALLTNNGAGGFLPVQSFVVGAGPYALSAGDLDGDGRPDLVVARSGQQLSVLHNTGAGFAPAVTYAALTPAGTDPYQSVALGDVDKDGDLDVLYSSIGTATAAGGAIALLRNDGTGALGAAEVLTANVESNGAVAIAVADVTGDDWPDILGAFSPRWGLLIGNGSGGFLPSQVFGATESPMGIDAADLDGDGDLDPVVLGRDSLEVAVYRNPGHGEFATPQSSATVGAAAGPTVARGLTSADIDGDGDLDLAVSYSNVMFPGGGVSILRNSQGTFLSPVQYPSPLHAIHVKLADLSGDGRPDLLWADDDPPYDVKTRMNTGTGNFGPIVNWPMNTCGNGEVGAIDVDDDGDLDIALCEYAGCAGGDPLNGKRVYLRKNNGDGTFQAPSIVIVSGFPERVHGGDVNGDGRTDLFVTGNSWIDVCLGLGNGAFQAPIAAPCDWGPKGFCVADLDDDGLLDLATTNYGDVGSGGESISILRGLGNGHFTLPVTLAASYSNTYGNSRDIVAGDADGDGDLDLMAGNWGSMDVSLYRNLGGFAFAPQVRYGTGWSTIDLAFGDFTGDGRGDLAALVSGGGVLTFKPAIVLLRGGVLPGAWTGLGHGLAGAHGVPALTAAGTLQGGAPLTLTLHGALPSTLTQLVVGLANLSAPFKGGVLVPMPSLLVALASSASGSVVVGTTWPAGVPAGLSIYLQDWIPDPSGPQGFAASNALQGKTP